MLQLYLMGLKRLYEEKPRRVYFKCKAALLLAAAAVALKHFRHKFVPEFENLDRPQFWVPRRIYRRRLEHHKYWELSRLARGLSATFTSHDFDPVSEFVFMLDERGALTSLRFNLDIETADRPDNPLFESYVNAFRADPSAANRETANRFLAYNLHKNRPLDLKNHLYNKPVTLWDFVRCVYSEVMVGLGLTNYFRYDHLLGKNDFLYEFERLRLALNSDQGGPTLDRQEVLGQMAARLKQIYSLCASKG